MKRIMGERTRTSLWVFGAYAFIMGLVLLLVPERVLPVFGFTEVSGSWVDVLGFVLCCSAYYYIQAGLSGIEGFARLTVHTRVIAPVVLLVLLAAGKVDHMVLLFGIGDALGGVWTGIAIWMDRNGSERNTPPA